MNMVQMPAADGHTLIRNLARVIEEFRKLDPEMQAQQIAIFLYVAAASPHVSMKDLERLTGLSGGGVSRNVAALGEIHRKGMPGHDLLTTRTNPLDRREKFVSLSAKGRRVYSSLEHIMS
jgi:DNA-binding MarR family transcriptional regulator